MLAPAAWLKTPIVKRACISAPGRDSSRDAANLEYPVTDTAGVDGRGTGNLKLIGSGPCERTTS